MKRLKAIGLAAVILIGAATIASATTSGVVNFKAIQVAQYLFGSSGSNGDVWTRDSTLIAKGKWAAGGGGGTTSLGVVNGRLTTETTIPVSTSDRTAQSTIYFTPYGGNQIGLYNGSGWTLKTFSELSLALSGLTSGKNYDVFIDYNSGTPQIVLSAAWSSDTARTDALALQDGIYVKSGTPAYRFVGTIRTTGTTTTEDSAAKRFVWNVYNRVPRTMRAATETADSWSYNSTTWRQANANTANQLSFVMGLAEGSTYAAISAMGIGSTSYITSIGIGCNSTTSPSIPFAQLAAGSAIGLSTATACPPVLGYSYIAWLESDGGSSTYYGDNGSPSNTQSGISGTIVN